MVRRDDGGLGMEWVESDGMGPREWQQVVVL
jgi:hypothetical protein